MTRRRERWRRHVSWHEAGHAIVARLVGKTCSEATIDPGRPDIAGAITREASDAELAVLLRAMLEPRPAPAKDVAAGLTLEVAFSLAGQVCDALRNVPPAVRNWTGRADQQHATCALDTVAELVHDTPGGVELSIRRAVARSLRLAWPRVRLVARTLERLGALHRTELDRLLAGLGPHAPEAEPIWRCAAGLAARVPADRMIASPAVPPMARAAMRAALADLVSTQPAKEIADD